MCPRYLQYLLTDFRQTFVTGASWDTDDLITFLGQKVRVQGHTIAAEAHSTRRYRRVQLFLVFQIFCTHRQTDTYIESEECITSLAEVIILIRCHTRMHLEISHWAVQQIFLAVLYAARYSSCQIMPIRVTFHECRVEDISQLVSVNLEVDARNLFERLA